MTLQGTPDGVTQNLNPISIVTTIPIFDSFIYLGIRKMGINFAPIKRIYTGFLAATLTTLCAAISSTRLRSMFGSFLDLHPRRYCRDLCFCRSIGVRFCRGSQTNEVVRRSLLSAPRPCCRPQLRHRLSRRRVQVRSALWFLPYHHHGYRDAVLFDFPQA